MGHASKRRELLVGTDQRITSGPAATAAASRQRQSSKRKQAGYMAAPERFAETSDSSCTAGAVHTWPFSSTSPLTVHRHAAPFSTFTTASANWRNSTCFSDFGAIAIGDGVLHRDLVIPGSLEADDVIVVEVSAENRRVGAIGSVDTVVATTPGNEIVAILPLMVSLPLVPTRFRSSCLVPFTGFAI